MIHDVENRKGRKSRVQEKLGGKVARKEMCTRVVLFLEGWVC